jgi:hypothetical protein
MGLLDLFRRKPKSAEPKPAEKRPQLIVPNPDGSYKIHAKVIGALHPGQVTVRVGTGIGMLDGGLDRDLPIDLIPIELRIPNSEFMLVYDTAKELVAIERIEKPIFGGGNV